MFFSRRFEGYGFEHAGVALTLMAYLRASVCCDAESGGGFVASLKARLGWR